MKAFFITYLISYSFLLPFSSNAQEKDESVDVDMLKQNAMEHFYYDRDSAYFYFDKIYELAERQNHPELKIETLFNSTGVASYNYDLYRMGKQLKQLDTLLHLKPDLTATISPDDQNIFLYYLGDYQLKIFENTNSRKSFETILENIKKTPDSLVTETMGNLSSAAYSFLGKIYMLEGKYDLAKQLYRRNIRAILKTEPTDLESLYGHYNLLAEVLMEESNYKEANNYLLKTIRYHQEKREINSLITVAFNIAENYTNLSQRDSALFYLEKAKANFGNKPLFYPKYYLKKASVYKANGEYDVALENLRTAEQIIDKEFPDQKNSDLPEVLNEIGTIEYLLDRPEKALINFDQALGKAKTNAEQNRYSLEILKNKATVLNGIGSVTSFKSALEAVLSGIQILDSLKPSFKSKGDKLFLIENSFPLFEMGLEASYALTNTVGDESFIDLAFEQMEKSKSILLLEALLASKATEFVDMPQALLERESQLKSEITFTEKELNASNSEAGKLEDELFDLQSEYRRLVEDIEANYKTYYDLKYSTAVVSLKGVQEKLEADEKLISYFYGNKTIFAVGVGKNGKQFEKIPIDSLLEARIRNIKKKISDPKSDVDVLAKESYELYKIILEPFVKSNDATKLTIIADGLLNYIPFGALNTAESGISYLMEKHSVSYGSSGTLLEQLSKNPSKNTEVLAFAPSFDGTAEVDTDRSKLLPLPHNKKEVAEVLHYFDGRSFSDDSATLENFKSELNNFGVLHFATHAVFDDAQPEYSYLAFSQRGSENGDEVLFTADLYNLKIDAALVTLSACETNIGELRKGEGFLSLARGFFYSGAKSIASTLWKVNDASSSEVMGEFYRQLSEGKSKDEALGQAKLLFLNHNDQNARKHPYYWAGYIISGNMEPIEHNQQMWPWLLGGILLIAGGAAEYAYRKKSA